MSLFSLEGKVALITGSTKGIGKAIAERMAEQGASVVISSRNQDACDEVAAAITARGHKAMGIACNINHKDQLHQLVDKTKAALGKIDVLVCNAALNPFFGKSQDIPDEAFDKIMHGSRLRGVICCSSRSRSRRKPSSALVGMILVLAPARAAISG